MTSWIRSYENRSKTEPMTCLMPFFPKSNLIEKKVFKGADGVDWYRCRAPRTFGTAGLHSTAAVSGRCCCSTCCQQSWAERSARRPDPNPSSWWRRAEDPRCTLRQRRESNSSARVFNISEAALLFNIKPRTDHQKGRWRKKKHLWTWLVCTRSADLRSSGSPVASSTRSSACAPATRATPFCHRNVLRRQWNKFERVRVWRHTRIEIYVSSPEVNPGWYFCGVNTMKSCLVPPNLRKAGFNALAKVLIFGELGKKKQNLQCGCGDCKPWENDDKKVLNCYKHRKNLRPIKRLKVCAKQYR